MSDDQIARLNAALEGRYGIERELGQGGMATVYLAQDLKHERKVALKVLKPELAAVVGAERFLAEIKTTANLQHPHILPLFDSGDAGGFLFYVMPYVQGESLREKLDREHQLPVEQAVRFATSMADALDYAHRQGVVHRDIKPANVLLQEGEPVLSDFGIALAVGVAGGGRLTETGLSLGTPHYMSPEQATGDQTVGAASDVYALGCVLYEMLVGEPPYTGSTAQAILGKIIQAKPVSATEARRSVPVNVDAAIRKALEKLSADRFTGAGDFARALADTGFRHGEAAEAGAGVAGGRSGWRKAVGPAVGLAVGVAGTLVLSSLLGPERPAPEVIRFTMTPPDSIALHATGNHPDLAISPDGGFVVFQSRAAGADYQLNVRWLDQLESTPLRGTEGASGPFVSWDGAWVGFVDAASPGTIRKVSILGGAPVTLAQLPGTTDGWSWGSDDRIVFGTRGGGLFRVPGGGGEPERLTTPDPEQGEASHVWPDVIEGRDAVVFVIALSTGSALVGGQLAVLDLASGVVRRLGIAGTYPRYLPTGHLVYAAEDGSVRAVAFDADALEVTGSPVPLVEGVGIKAVGAANFDVSTNGRLVYAVGGAGGGEPATLVWVDRSGREEPIPAPVRSYIYPRLSPNGDRVALDVRGEDGDLWIWDFGTATPIRLILGDGLYYYPIWTPDGERIAYSTGAGDIYWKASNNTGTPEPLAEGAGGAGEGRVPGPYFFSPDGSMLVFRDQANPETNDDIVMIPVEGDGAPVWKLNSGFRERNAELSPNGRWMAYQSDESGVFQIYVRPFPNQDEDQIPVSNNGGTHPLWSRDGRELFYLEPGGGAPRLMSASVNTDDAGGDFSFTERRLIMEWPYYPGGEGRPYDVSLDGERFLAIKPVGTDGQGGGSTEITIVLGWAEELLARVPN